MESKLCAQFASNFEGATYLATSPSHPPGLAEPHRLDIPTRLHASHADIGLPISAQPCITRTSSGLEFIGGYGPHTSYAVNTDEPTYDSQYPPITSNKEVNNLPTRSKSHHPYLGVRIGEASHPGPVEFRLDQEESAPDPWQFFENGQDIPPPPPPPPEGHYWRGAGISFKRIWRLYPR